jgi:hypothetical protein
MVNVKPRFYLFHSTAFICAITTIGNLAEVKHAKIRKLGFSFSFNLTVGEGVRPEPGVAEVPAPVKVKTTPLSAKERATPLAVKERVQDPNQALLKTAAPVKVTTTPGCEGKDAGLEPGVAEGRRPHEDEGDLWQRRGRCRSPNQARLKSATHLKVKATSGSAVEGVGARTRRG